MPGYMESNLMPSRIVLFRHGEKFPAPGSSERVGQHLSNEGFVRAIALAAYIPKALWTPDYLFAARPTKRSNRSVETLTPLAAALGLTINSSYADNDYEMLAHDILTQPQYAGANVAICWHHGKIPPLAAALGVRNPPGWPERVFDRVWHINYRAGRATLREEVQMLNAEARMT